MKPTNAMGIDHPKLDPEVRTLLEAGSAMPDVLPPAFVVTAGCDPLCSEGKAYAERPRTAGVEVTVRRFDGMPHGFLGFPALGSAKQAMTDISDAIRAHL